MRRHLGSSSIPTSASPVKDNLDFRIRRSSEVHYTARILRAFVFRIWKPSVLGQALHHHATRHLFVGGMLACGAVLAIY
ncbi:hypothetical protein AVEN_184314-1 [Araneus ventricosus]|uniref:Uncharacterized protein n=1 Tax=Araneus ventricosus TaxID=182803 RepID=A0A4Y2K305_ARAVE|nr:hypothetical protein AVEN_184314-1 [Araneus ventricosus]